MRARFFITWVANHIRCPMGRGCYPRLNHWVISIVAGAVCCAPVKWTTLPPAQAAPPAGAETAPGTPTNQKGLVIVALQRGGSLLFVPVTINGKDAGHFVVDTGASNTVIHTELADELKLPKVADATITGAGGSLEATIRQARSFKLGEYEVGRHRIAATDLSVWSQMLGVPIGGLLGQSALASQPFTLDYSAAKITFYDRSTFKPPADGVEQKVKVR